jgi:hypothetical protein
MNPAAAGAGGLPAAPVVPAIAQIWIDAADKARSRDLYCAKKISGLGQIEPHDAHGNIKALVWAPQLDFGAVGRLVQPRQIENKMWETMNVQIEDTKHMLKQLPDTKDLPTWMFGYVKSWEDVYKVSVARKYDIGQPVLSAMYEAMFEIRRKVKHTSIDERSILNVMNNWKLASAIPDELALDADEMAMRFLFRHQSSSKHMCHIAGAILQKNEACGKPGSFAATRMRHDLTSKIDMCIQQVSMDTDYHEPAEWLQDLTVELAAPFAPEKRYYLIDHTKV